MTDVTGITVNLSGSWSAKQRSNNGLDLVAAHVRKEWKDGRKLPRIPVVGYIEYHNWHEPLSGPQLVVAIPLIEPALEADGSDPNGVGKQVMDLLDQLRKQRGKGSADDVPSRSGELAGQAEFDFDGPADEPTAIGEVRLTGDGPRAVPEASGEEIAAERAEKRAAEKELNEGVIAELGGEEPKPPTKFTSVGQTAPAKGRKPATDPFTPGDAA